MTAKEAQQRAAALKAIEESEARIAGLIQASANANASDAAAIERKVKAEEARISFIEKQITKLDQVKSLNDDIAGAIQASAKEVQNANKQIKNMFSGKSDVATVTKQIEINEKLIAKAIKAGNKDAAKTLSTSTENLKTQRAGMKIQKALSDDAAELKNDLAESVSNITDFVSAIPGGGFLLKATGLDKVNKKLEESITSAVMAFGETGSVSAGVRAFSSGLMAGLGPIGAIALAVGGLVMLFQSVSHQAHEIAEATGLTYSQSKALVKEANNIVRSGQTQLATTEDILEVQKQITSEFGVAAMMSGETAAEVADIGKAFGYGAGQAAKVNAQFMSMGMSAENAADMQRELAAEALKAGVSVGTVTADIAENASEVAVYFGGNTKELKKAAIQAAKLGVSLKTMADVSEGLLNFEESIAAQFEFQALSGRQINLDLARQLALEGDIAGATAEVLSQVGDIHDFNQMDVLERQALAKATGMSVNELQKSLTIQDKLADATDEQRAAAAGLGLSAAELADMSAEELQNKVAQKQASDKLAASFATIKATLVDALMPAAEALMGVFQMLSPILKGIAVTIGAILAPVKVLGAIFSGTTSDLSTMDVILASIGAAFGVIYGLAKAQSIITATQIGYEKVKAAFGVKETLQKTLINNAERLGLITANQKTLALGRQTMIEKGNLAQANTMNLYKNQGLLTQIKSNVQAGIANVRAKASNMLTAAGNALQSTRLGTFIAQNVQRAIAFTRDTASNALAMGRQVIEKGILAVQLAINTAKTVANVIAAGAVVPLLASAGAAIAAAIPAIFTGFGMIPFGLGIPLAFAAVAGLIGLIASMSKGDDVISKPSGGGGYGSRVLFGPEGAISFNNKDTIVAGTDLFTSMNDGIIAPKGALKVNDYSSDMPDPPEAKIVGITGESVAKLSVGIALAIGTGMAPAFTAALALSMPLIGATITGAIVAGYAATAMIPKPVLILNPVLPTFETNPIIIAAAAMQGIGGLLSAVLNPFGNKKEDENSQLAAAFAEAMDGVEIKMDGAKVGTMVKIAGTYNRG